MAPYNHNTTYPLDPLFRIYGMKQFFNQRKNVSLVIFHVLVHVAKAPGGPPFSTLCDSRHPCRRTLVELHRQRHCQLLNCCSSSVVLHCICCIFVVGFFCRKPRCILGYKTNVAISKDCKLVVKFSTTWGNWENILSTITIQ